MNWQFYEAGFGKCHFKETLRSEKSGDKKIMYLHRESSCDLRECHKKMQKAFIMTYRSNPCFPCASYMERKKLAYSLLSVTKDFKTSAGKEYTPTEWLFIVEPRVKKNWLGSG